MSSIERVDLRSALNNITQKDWKEAVKRLGLVFDVSSGRGSHCVIRDSNYPITDIRSLVSTVPKKLYKKMNIIIFEQLMVFGLGEDDIWKALKLMK